MLVTVRDQSVYCKWYNILINNFFIILCSDHRYKLAWPLTLFIESSILVTDCLCCSSLKPAYSQPTFKFYLSANKTKKCSWEKEVFCPLTHPTTTQSSLKFVDHPDYSIIKSELCKEIYRSFDRNKVQNSLSMLHLPMKFWRSTLFGFARYLPLR